MTQDEMEHLERTTLAMVVQALKDYYSQAKTIFQEETDLPQDIAEDVLREAIEAMGIPGLRHRLYGKVDFKKAIYVFLPEAQPVALMLDAKAEKPNGNRTATIQMSQTSMRVRMIRGNQTIDEPGRLQTEIVRGSTRHYVVTIIAKFVYEDRPDGYELQTIIVTCIPNGQLQDRYNPTPTDTIWRAGRDAPTLGEDFRVRVSYTDLSRKAPWRVRELEFHP